MGTKLRARWQYCLTQASRPGSLSFPQNSTENFKGLPICDKVTLHKAQGPADHLNMFVVPRSCWGCQADLASHSQAPHICPHCTLGIEPLEKKLAPSAHQGLYAYQGVMAELLNRLKLQGQRNCARPLGELFWQAPANPLRQDGAIDYVVPVPLHWRRRWRRGFNQCDLVLFWASATAPEKMPPDAPGLLFRTRHTRPQRGLDRASRKKNVQGAFAARPDHVDPDASILVVDDVSTTGETLTQALQALRRAGYRKGRGLALMKADRSLPAMRKEKPA